MSKKEKKSTKATEEFIEGAYWKQVKSTKIYFIAPIASLVAYVVSTNVTPIFFSEFIGSASRGEYKKYGDLIKPLLILLSLYLAKFMFYVLETSVWTETIYRSEKPLMLSALKSVTKKSKSFFADNFSGSLMSQISNFFGSFQNILTQYNGNLLPSLASMAFIMIYVGIKSPLLLLPFVLTITVYGSVVALTRRKRSRLARKLQEARSDFNGFLSDSISNVDIFKSEGLEQFELSRVGDQMDKFRIVKREYMMFSNNVSRINNSLAQVLSLMSLSFAAVLFIQGRVGVEVVILMSFYGPSLTSSIFSLTNLRIETQNIFNQTADMAEIMMQEPEIRDPENPTKLKIEGGQIDFQKASFKYTDSSEEVKGYEEDKGGSTPKKKQEVQHLFQNLSLTIKPGEKVGLVGPSGGGKSTLLKLILRFYDVDSGEVKIDGVNVKDVIQSKLRQQIAYVPQDPALFHRSISENIGYSKPGATQRDVKLAAQKAYADEFIKTLPDGYDTLVGERGVKLSGGQRQRVAIARAILKDAPILLLDEATSALDSESESYIQKSLQRLMEGRTTVVVAHRLSTIRRMDRIIVVEKGRVVDSGSHEELLKTSKLYKKLWSHQSGGILQD